MTTRRLPLRLAACSPLLVLTLACGSDGPTGPSTPPAPTTGTISLTNNANVPIVEVNLSSCSDDEWGDNRLAAGEVIAPSATRTWTLIAGCYDIRAHTATKAGSWYDKAVGAGSTLTLALSSAANALVLTVEGRAGR